MPASKTTTKPRSTSTAKAKKAAPSTAQRRTAKSNGDGITRFIGATEDVERSTLDAVRKFIDSVNSALPDVGEDGLRERIIDSAFDMVDHLVNASNRLARDIAKLTEDTLHDLSAGAEKTAKGARAKSARKS